MAQLMKTKNAAEIASMIDAEIRALAVHTTPNIRAIRRKYSRQFKQANPAFILDLAKELFENYGYRWVAYELLRNHEPAFKRIGEAELKKFGRGINSWGTVDAFAGILAGPAWLKGQVPDRLIHKWAHSKDRWWRRTALVSTVALNRRAMGGNGDVPRTLQVCRLLVDDHDDMVVKAMSWALRELVIHDADAVREFLSQYEDILAARVKREVRNKLTTGLKNPKQVEIRPQRVTDAKDFYDILSDPKLHNFPVHPESVEIEKEFLRLNAEKRKKNLEYNFAVIYDKRLIGAVGVMVDQFRKYIGEIGYFLDSKYWGKGIAGEAVKLIEKFAFNRLKLKRLEILIETTNRASERVAIKCGYKKEGVLRGKLLNKGNYFDGFLYAKVKEDN